MGDSSSSSSSSFNMPPGFRFYPTDEELVVHFLHRKAALLPCHPDVIPDLDLYPYDPWDLHGKAMCEGNKWYFYSRRTERCRMSGSGYWQPIGAEEPIHNSMQRVIGMKKSSAFYLGHQPSPSQGVITNWIMHEYRLPDSTTTTRSSSSSTTDYSKWVVCRVYERNCDSDDDGTQLSCLDEVFLSLDDLDEISLPNYC